MAKYFFTVGSATTFFDLFTTPLVTIGVPLLVYILLIKKDKANFKTIVLEIIRLCFIWGLGYGLTWFTKWMLVDILFNRQIIQNAIAQIQIRTSNISGDYSYILECTLGFLSKRTICIIGGIVVLYVIGRIFIMIKNRETKISIKNRIIDSLPFLCIATFPFIWFKVVEEHSAAHAFFTYRNIVITIIGVLLAIKVFCEGSHKEEKNKNKGE